MTTQKSVLGKGLASLLPGSINLDTSAAAPKTAMVSHPIATTTGEPIFVEIKDIQANPYQPRKDFDDLALKELSDSIKTNGVIQPIVVRKTPSGYELIAGERRLRASKLAGLEKIPVVLRQSTNKESLEMALVENIQRQNLNCVDEAIAYQKLLQEYNLTQEEVALRVGKDRATVANHLRLLKHPEKILNDLRSGALSLGHGKALLALEAVDQKLFAAEMVLQKKLSVRETEELIRQIQERKISATPLNGVKSLQTKSPLQLRFENLAKEITQNLSARVFFKGNDKKGKIILQYSSKEELEQLIQKLR